MCFRGLVTNLKTMSYSLPIAAITVYHKFSRLNNTKINFLIVLEVRSPKLFQLIELMSKYCQGYFFVLFLYFAFCLFV